MAFSHARRSRRWSGFSGFGVAVLALTGCAVSDLPEVGDLPEVPAPVPAVSAASASASASLNATPAIDPYVNLDKLPAFYQEAIRTFPHPLPDGVAWPAKIPAGFDDPNVHYEPEGRGEALASTYWLCAWQGEYLNAFESQEQQRRAEALTMLDAFVVDPYFTKAFLDPERGWKRDVLDPARNGDTWRMKSQYSSCPAAE